MSDARARYADVVAEYEAMRAENERLRQRVRDLVATCDHYAGTPCAEIRWEQERDELRGLLREARAVIFYAFNDESANEPHDAGENLMYTAMLARIDAALHDNSADVSVRAAVQPQAVTPNCVSHQWEPYAYERRKVVRVKCGRCGAERATNQPGAVFKPDEQR